MATAVERERPTRALMVREFDAATLDEMHAAAKARGLSMRDYLARLYQLHVGLRQLATHSDEAGARMLLEGLQLQSVTR